MRCVSPDELGAYKDEVSEYGKRAAKPSGRAEAHRRCAADPMRYAGQKQRQRKTNAQSRAHGASHSFAAIPAHAPSAARDHAKPPARHPRIAWSSPTGAGAWRTIRARIPRKGTTWKTRTCPRRSPARSPPTPWPTPCTAPCAAAPRTCAPTCLPPCRRLVPTRRSRVRSPCWTACWKTPASGRRTACPSARTPAPAGCAWRSVRSCSSPAISSRASTTPWRAPIPTAACA